MKLATSLPLLALLGAGVAAAEPATGAPTPSAPATAAPASADPATAPPSATAPAAGLSVSADLRDEYLAGQDLLVLINLVNGGSSPVTVPDLTARPWRVKFRFTLPSGQVQNRFNTPPAQEPTASWTIPARGQKRVLLAVPSGEGLKEGSYTLAIEVDLGDRKETLPARPIRLVQAKPVSGHLAPDALLAERDGLAALWLHQATKGFDLYLATLDARAPERGARNDFLAHLEQRVDPRLTAARPGAGDRYVVWAASDRSLGYLRIEGGRVEGAVRTLDLPWPKAELIGQGGTDARGRLHVPLWIPAPQGSGGELRLASVDERGRPQFRKMTSLPARPAQVRTVVDVAGGVNVMVMRPGLVDLYTLRPDYPDEVPVPGERLWAAEEGQELAEVRFGGIPAVEGQAGGLGALVLWRQAGVLEGQWVSLQGKALQRVPATPLAADARVLAVTPRGKEAPGLVVQPASGAARYVEGASSQGLGALPSGGWDLVRDGQARPLLLALKAKSGVEARVLTPSAPAP